jgi:hypothetical protein
MIGFLFFVGWAGIIGSALDALIALYALWVIIGESAQGWGLSLDVLFRDYISWLFWVKQLGYIFLPAPFIEWIFGLPALIFFSVRVVASGIIGGWAFNKASKLALKEG